MAEQPIPACQNCGGRCCTAYIVPLCGYDVWVLARAHLPSENIRRDPEDYQTDTGFLLGAAGPTYGLALRHQVAEARVRSCVFLQPAVNGAQLCGIYAHRPLACQTYPLLLRRGTVVPRDDMLCPPGSWAGQPGSLAESAELLRRQDRAWRDYALVVAAWNAALRERSGSDGYVLAEFLRYIVQAYDRFADLQALDLQARTPSELKPALGAFARAWLAGQ